MKSLPKEAENLILDSIEDVCAHVSDGDHPTDAVIKVAEERELSPNFIKLVCTGYNTGATNFQFGKEARTLSKMAEFPIADVNAVIEKIYPSKPEKASVLKASSAISDEYKRKPVNKQASVKHLEKLAAEKLPVTEKKAFVAPVEDRMAKAYGQAQAIKRELEVKRALYAREQDELLLAIGKLTRQVKYANVDFPTFEYVATHTYKELGKSICDTISARLPNTKRASATPAKLVTVDWAAEPYSTLAECVKHARAVHGCSVVYRWHEEKAQEKIAELLNPFEVARPEMPEKKASVLLGAQPEVEKVANGFLGGMLGGALQRSLQAPVTNTLTPKPTSELVSGTVNELDDPDHENELRKIQARTMMQDLLLNDEIISGYDPGEVLDAYNEIVSVTPRAATQAAIIRPLLRRRLQGSMEPFEASEMLNIEKSLGQSAHTPAQPSMPQAKEGSHDVLRHRILG